MANKPEIKPFRQIPTWQSTDKFEITGEELQELYGFFNIFAPAFTSIQQVFARGIQNGQIKIGYEYEDGTPVADDEIADYTKQLNEYFKNKLATESTDSKESTGAILNVHGAPATSEG
jgi:hypothetical protein